jgi:hypothetical protein
MSRASDLSRLAGLAQLMLDHRLGLLRTRADELDQSRMQLAAVNDAAQPAGLEPVIAQRVELVYDRWADVRRSELNLVISRQTVSWLDARSEAQTAFGRMQALQDLAARQRGKT